MNYMVTILSLGKALPRYSFSQEEIAQKIVVKLFLDDKKAFFLEKLYKNSKVGRRYSVLPDLLVSDVGMSQRNALYKKEAPSLALKSAQEALEKWGQPVSGITHVISVTCTGAITPGIEFKLIQDLKLKASTARLGINFMGCFGAFKGLSIAHKIASTSSKNRILVVCTELCSLHFSHNNTPEAHVIHSLFADGAACAIVGSELGLKKPRSLK